jgi:hypothetical protein
MLKQKLADLDISEADRGNVMQLLALAENIESSLQKLF